MLKSAMYFNDLLLLIISIIFMIRIFMKKKELNTIKKLIIIYIIFNFISIYLWSLVETGWNFFLILAIFAITFIIHIISICCINKEIKKSNTTDYNNSTNKKYIFLIIIPIIIFIIPYTYELYVLNNCSYLLKYSQNGIIISEDTNIAIINNKPVPTTLEKNLFNRKGISTEKLNYDVDYTNGIEISKEDSRYEDIKKIALDVKERCPSTKWAYIDYIPEGKFAVVTLYNGTYFYYNNKYIQNIKSYGDLSSVTYYK